MEFGRLNVEAAQQGSTLPQVLAGRYSKFHIHNMLESIIIAGPTASGKTALSIALAQQLDGEIISADSRQIYRCCDIVTAKPTRDEQLQARHHLIDICEPEETFSALQWAQRARATIGEIQSRDKTPIICGGTGFYLRALLQPHLFDLREPDENLRFELEKQWDENGAESLYQRLQVLAPQRAASIALNDRYRIIRALQIALTPPASTCNQVQPINARVYKLQWPREILYQRIETRIEQMIEDGAWQELRALIESGVPLDAPILNSVGYRQMLPALNDKAQRAAAIALWKQESRRYAKRQETWFRHQLEGEVLDMTQDALQVLAGFV